MCVNIPRFSARGWLGSHLGGGGRLYEKDQPVKRSFLLQSTNSAPGGPKSWAQLNGRPARQEGGEFERRGGVIPPPPPVVLVREEMTPNGDELKAIKCSA